MVEPIKFRQELFAIKGFLCPWGRAWPRCTSRWARPSRMDYFHCIHVTGQKRNLQMEDISFLPHVQAQPSSSSLLSPYITVALRHPAAWWHNISRQLRRRLRTRTDNAQVRHEEEGLTQEHRCKLRNGSHFLPAATSPRCLGPRWHAVQENICFGFSFGVRDLLGKTRARLKKKKRAYYPGRPSNIYEFFSSCGSVEACWISLRSPELSSSLYSANGTRFIWQDFFYHWRCIHLPIYESICNKTCIVYMICLMLLCGPEIASFTPTNTASCVSDLPEVSDFGVNDLQSDANYLVVWDYKSSSWFNPMAPTSG